MTKPLSLDDLAARADEVSEGVLSVPFGAGLLPPTLMQNLRRLQRLDLLTGDTLLSLIAQAPIDPLGLYGALKHTAVWAFQPLDFTVVQVLASKGKTPVAVMRIDLMSNDITFVALQGGLLVEHHTLRAEEFAAKMQEGGMTEARILAWLQEHINETKAAGLTAQ